MLIGTGTSTDTGNSNGTGTGTSTGENTTDVTEFKTITATIPSGLQSCGSATRIVGGSSAVQNSWPWIVRLDITDGLCGGTIIGKVNHNLLYI